eukprot:4525325-Prymnesium_polylepis.1
MMGMQESCDSGTGVGTMGGRTNYASCGAVVCACLCVPHVSAFGLVQPRCRCATTSARAQARSSPG